jgi:hypoxanthine phosphoribosyltransferase
VCALLVRDELVIDESDLTYVGFRISPQWVVGYGLDAGERYRNLREVRSFTGATG